MGGGLLLMDLVIRCINAKLLLVAVIHTTTNRDASVLLWVKYTAPHYVVIHINVTIAKEKVAKIVTSLMVMIDVLIACIYQTTVIAPLLMKKVIRYQHMIKSGVIYEVSVRMYTKTH
jgi:hypothetical protein